MPELPEVETMCRGIAPIVGCTVKGIELPPCKCRPISIKPSLNEFRRRAIGRKVIAIKRAGKRVVIWLAENAKHSDGRPISSDPERIVIEPRMTGLVLLADPPTKEHLRLCLKLTGRTKQQLLFWDRRGLGSVRLLSAAEFEALYGPRSKTLGPDALDITAEQLKERLGKSRRAIKVALLDQRAIAGVGNLYASEMLHLARIHPAVRCHRLRGADWQHLHAAMRKILLAAIKYEGSTLSDGTYRNAVNESGGYQNHHRVYDRAQKLCPTCRKETIRRIVQAQRSTFFCPYCQKR